MTDEKTRKRLEEFVEKLLHLEDPNNRQVNLFIDENGTPQKSDVYTLYDGRENFGVRLYRHIRNKIGSGVSTYLKDSAEKEENALGKEASMVVSWRSNAEKNLERSAQKQLSKFIDDIYKEMQAKGMNVLFLSIGAVRWKTPDGTIESPLIIFPIRLVRKIDYQPVGVEFVDDEIYFNECFNRLFAKIYGEQLEPFPLPVINGERTVLIDPNEFDVEEYFQTVENYVANCKLGTTSSGTLEFLKDEVAIARYTHDDICMYRDIKAHEKEISESKLIRRVFGNELVGDEAGRNTELRFVLKYDSVQREIADKVINGGKCVKVQGPPGTGKTQTIANVLACAIAADKKVLFVSKKIPALEEVYAKLPEELRPFVLKIEIEKENLAVKMSPHEIHKEFNRTLKYRLPELNKTGVESMAAQLRKNATEKKRDLDLYCRALFGDELKNGYSFYDALTAYCKIIDCPTVRFETPSIKYALTMDKTVYEDLLRKITELSENFDYFTGGKKYLPRRSPYFGIRRDRIYDEPPAKEEIDKVRELQSELADAVSCFPETRLDALRVFSIIARASELDVEFVKKYSETKELSRLIDALRAAIDYREKLKEDGLDGEFSSLKYGNGLNRLQVYGAPNISNEFLPMKIAALEGIEKYFTDAQINKVRKNRKELQANIAVYDAAMEKYLSEKETVVDVLGSGVTDDEKKKKALLKLQNKLEKLKSLDGMGAKSVLKKIKEVRSLTTPIADQRLVDGARAVIAMEEALQTLDEARTQIGVFTESEITENTVLMLKTMFELSSGAKTMERVVEEIPAILQWINASFTATDVRVIADLLKDGTVEDAFKIAKLARDYKGYCEKIREINEIKRKIEGTIEKSDGEIGLIDTAELRRMKDDCLGVFYARRVSDPDKLIKKVRPLARKIRDVAEFISDFAAKNTEEFMDKKSVYHEPYSLTVDDLRIFCESVGDKKHRDSVYDFQKKLQDGAERFSESFFRPFTVGTNDGYKKYTFAEIFEHSFFGLFIESVKEIAKKKAALNNAADVLRTLGVDTRGKINEDRLKLAAELYGDFIEKFENGDIEEIRAQYAKIDDEIIENNVKLIALKQIERLKTLVSEHKNTFAVFDGGGKSQYKNVRLLFKNEATAIMRVKNCFIVSPSTVSSLMGNGEYKFDIAIFDEASQIEPQYLIPVLFRAKQCVIIGDEHQMPPIKHFVRNGISDVDNDDDYQKAESGLDLVSAGQGAFDGYSLRCHYRSKSESLIAYSQRYYPDMITFPSKTSFNDRMGIRDEYVETFDETAASGVNPTEARKVIEVLKRHFEVTPEQSVGVMTFGDAQAQFIAQLIGKDSELSKHFTTKSDDCFIKPIAKLQGREVDHVIMSMTYGKSYHHHGQIVNLGDLNRSYGEQIFNVAASRAKYKLTVIHSFTDTEIAASNVSAKDYLAEFLRVVKKHSAHGESGFTSTDESEVNGFLADVVKFITRECEIDGERIVVNYGATEKSLRIPIVILDKERKAAETAIFCDVPPIVGGRTVEYSDFAVKYRRSLLDTREWDRSAVVNVCDWVNNGEKERELLKKFLQK